jgi:hypothetical protein
MYLTAKYGSLMDKSRYELYVNSSPFLGRIQVGLRPLSQESAMNDIVITAIEIFYQGEGLGEIQYLEIEPNATFGSVKSRLSEMHGLTTESLLFIEDDEVPLDDDCLVSDRADQSGIKCHVHRCRHIEVTVAFNAETAEHRFSPSATIAKVKCWVAEHKFGMTPEEAGEHVLQIAGTHDRPTPGTHIGALTDGRICGLAFDLVPDERVNGSSVPAT